MNNDTKNNKEIAEALNDCMESMLTRNESVDSCLRRYPMHAAALKPLLETIKAARVASSLSAAPSFRARARYEFRSALYANSNIARKTHPGPALRWATAFSTVGIFLLTGAGGAVAASSSSMPGQPLYQLKRDVENVQLTLTPSQAGKARLYAAMADRRVNEIVFAAQSGDVQSTQDLTEQFTSDLYIVSTLVTPSSAATTCGSQAYPSLNGLAPGKSTTRTASDNTIVPTDSETYAPVTTTAPPGAIVTVAPAPMPTIIIDPSQVTVTQAAAVPSPVYTLPEPNITIEQPNSLNNPALLKLLQQYSIKNIAELLSVLDKVPPSAKAALLAAIQAATSGYSQILGS